MDGQLQGPRDHSGLHEESGGIRQRPGMAQIRGMKESPRAENIESKNVVSERGSSALFTAEASGQRGDAKLSSCRRQGLG